MNDYNRVYWMISRVVDDIMANYKDAIASVSGTTDPGPLVGTPSSAIAQAMHVANQAPALVGSAASLHALNRVLWLYETDLYEDEGGDVEDEEAYDEFVSQIRHAAAEWCKIEYGIAFDLN